MWWADVDENDYEKGDYNDDDKGTDIGHWRLKCAEQILLTLWLFRENDTGIDH